MTNQNTLVYEKAHIVSSYSKADELQKPESAVIQSLKSFLPSMDVLDIGIGAGRTSHHLLPLAKTYAGIDISQSMVNACKERFPKYAACFSVGDATDMKSFSSASKDLVVFSFNGIDCVDEPSREKVFREVFRILKPNGYFLFSSHNSRFDLLHRHRFTLASTPRELWRNIRRWFLFRWYNPDYLGLKEKPRMFLRDGSESFGLSICYSYPETVLKELEHMGFSESKMYSIQTGELISLQEANNLKDPWFYYLCRKH